MTSIRVSVGNPSGARLSGPVWAHPLNVFAVAVPGKAPVVVSVVEADDQSHVKALFRNLCLDRDKVDPVLGRSPGIGKRDVLACASRAIARRCAAKGDVVAVNDCDSIVPRDPILISAGFHLHDLRSGAPSADEMSGVRGSRILHERYAPRFTKRRILMSSKDLSGRGIVFDRPCGGFIRPPCCRTVTIAPHGGESWTIPPSGDRYPSPPSNLQRRRLVRLWERLMPA